MSDKMTPMPPGKLIEWMIHEKRVKNALFGVNKIYVAPSEKKLNFLGVNLETPVGPAAGPHTQLSQNLAAAYAGGARFFELKTVQTLDGEDLPVEKPCIYANDECYNVEWSTELRVPQALDEYVKGWFVIKLMAREYGLGEPDAFLFNMSVGYDLAGISSKKIDDYIEGMRDAGSLPIWQELKRQAHSLTSQMSRVDSHYIDSIDPRVSNSVTLSTLHGCPPDEIERIASYLIDEKGLNTFVKVNPTLLGYKTAREILDNLGYDYIEFDDHHFVEDLQFSDAVPMLKRLQEKANTKGLGFGVKVTNTFPVDIAHHELPGQEMYMSGRSLYPLSITVAKMLSEAFDGKLRLSLSGGVDAFNAAQVYDTGIWPITVATTLLKTGGYDRMKQIAEKIYSRPYGIWNGIDNEKLSSLQKGSLNGELYKKAIKPLPSRKIGKKVPLLDCFIAPCVNGCPIHQDVPAYVGLAGQRRYDDALRVILDKNPLPFITGTICSHRCMDKCTRNFYEQSVRIRDTKLLAATMGMENVYAGLKPPKQKGKPVAIIGGGAAGMACAFFLARSGVPVTLFEKEPDLGGIVRYVIPQFRIPQEAIEQDAKLVKKMGVNLKLGQEAPSIEELRKQGFSDIVIATGAHYPGRVDMDKGDALGVLEFLRKFRAGVDQNLGENVVIIGGGNTAMDAARAAKRVAGVKNVYIVYRRTKRYMPADEEELILAMEDGVEFKELLAPKSHEDGKLLCSVMKLGEPDESGRRSPVMTDETTTVPADTVIAAVGDRVDTEALQKMGLNVDSRGRAVVDANLMGSVRGVYIIGDVHRGPATVVEAIADARTAADHITNARGAHPYVFDDGLEREKKGVLVFSDDADNEAQRCLECNIICENCVDVCPNRANISILVKGKLQIVHIDAMCNECGNCETFCPYESAPYKDKFTLFSSEEGFIDSQNEGFYVRPDQKYHVRLNGAEFVTDGSGLPEGIEDLIKAIISNARYFI